MKNQIRHKPTAGKFSILRQLCNRIPPHLVPKLARDTGVEEHSRTFSPWSQVVNLLYAQTDPRPRPQRCLGRWSHSFTRLFALPPLGPLAKTRTAQSPGKLWDSRRRWTLLGTARTSLFARLGLILWDSRFHQTVQATHIS
jgi:hypothetical protein